MLFIVDSGLPLLAVFVGLCLRLSGLLDYGLLIVLVTAILCCVEWFVPGVLIVYALFVMCWVMVVCAGCLG